MTEHLIETDKKKLNRRKFNGTMIHKFDRFLESRTSIILGWFWKSGIMMFLITLVGQNLIYQKENSEKLVNNTSKIIVLTDSNNRTVQLSLDNTEKILSIKEDVFLNKSDIKYLRRDVDGLLDRNFENHSSTRAYDIKGIKDDNSRTN